MNKELYGHILQTLKSGEDFTFELIYPSPAESPSGSYASRLLPTNLKDVFEEWLHINLVDFLAGNEVYNSGEFEFVLLIDVLYLKCRTTLEDINNNSEYSVRNILTDNVLKVLFNKKDIIDIDFVYLNFEYEYMSNKWEISLNDSSQHFDGYKEIDFSTIDVIKLKELIHLNVKDFDHNDVEPSLEYKNESKRISSIDSRISVTKTITFITPVDF